MKTASAEDLLLKVLARAFKPRTQLNTHQWAKEHVRLDQRFTSRPGPYNVDYTPYMRGPHEWFSDPNITEISGCKSRQVGGTTFLANCMMYAVGEDPGPILYVTSTLGNAQAFSEREWLPRIDLSETLSALKPDNKDDFKKTEQHFKTCTAKLTGSNSPSNLMSRPVRYLFEDEVDTWPQDNGEEAPSMEIVEACTLSYAHAKKILRISTPTVPTGAIWTCYKRGSQHKYHVPCPHCDHKFELLFEHLEFHRDECKDSRGIWNLDKVAEKATLKCPNHECGKSIRQNQQGEMVSKGIWIQTNPDSPKHHISWHISALYSPTITWGQIAVLFLQQKDTPGGLHDFYNHYLGLPFTREATTVTETDVHRVRDASPEYLLYNEKNQKWTLPAEMALILMAVDVQQSGFWWAQRALCWDESSYLLDYGPAASWGDLETLVERQYRQPNGELLGIYKAAIDSGYIAKRESGVYDFCIQSGGRFWPIQGRSATHGLFQPIRETTFEHRGLIIPGIQIRDDLYKEHLYLRRIKERAGSPWFVARNICSKYVAQLTDEKLVPRKTERGTEIMEWRDKGNNHLGDVEKYLAGLIDLVLPIIRELREEREKKPGEKEQLPPGMVVLS
jgi:phage terminase large subunit GpA-like protein